MGRIELQKTLVSIKSLLRLIFLLVELSQAEVCVRIFVVQVNCLVVMLDGSLVILHIVVCTSQVKVALC